MSAGRLAAASAGALGGLAVFASLALAGYPVDSHNEGKAKGLSYRSATSVFAGAGGATATCPEGRFITGGGAILDGATADAQLTELGPDFLTDDVPYKRGFAGRGDVDGIGQELTVYAICAKKEGLTFKRKQAGFTSPGDPFVGMARCPGGTHVVGGGFDTDSSSDGIVTSAPRDAGDADNKPDDGWIARFASGFQPGAVRVTAICSEAQRIIYRKESTTAATGEHSQSAACPDDTAVTGGGAAMSGEADAFIHSSHPADIGDTDTTPSDGWAAKGYAAPGPQSLTVYAICKR